MSSVNFDPESPYGQQLKVEIAEKLKTMNLTDDPAYVAEFLLVLISNNRTAEDIYKEFQTLFGSTVTPDFINQVINEVKSNANTVTNTQQQETNQSQSIPAPQQVQVPAVQETQVNIQSNIPQRPRQQQQQQQQQPQPNIPQQPASAFQASAFQPSPFQPSPGSDDVPMEGDKPTHPMSAFSKSTLIPKGISKKGNIRGKRSYAMRNQRNFTQLMNKSLNNGTNVRTTHFIPRKPLGRCKKFPYCHDRNCRYAHPMKICFAYPNCPNPPGTCNYLHPGEDDALIAEVEKIKQERMAHKIERNNNMIRKVSHQVEQRLLKQTNGITLCKFGSVCQREMCPFGHPTPANKDAKVLTMEWCPDNKNCTDPNCTKAHSSPNYKPPEKAGEAFAGGMKRSLEQCKFGRHCKNPHCPKRHATTNVLCRDGANCKRIDCYFQHPIDEDCKFGVNCKNPNCPYRHPDGRQQDSGKKNMVWVNTQANNVGDGASSFVNTDQRQFAVPEDQVMEQAPPQQQ